LLCFYFVKFSLFVRKTNRLTLATVATDSQRLHRLAIKDKPSDSDSDTETLSEYNYYIMILATNDLTLNQSEISPAVTVVSTPTAIVVPL